MKIDGMRSGPIGRTDSSTRTQKKGHVKSESAGKDSIQVSTSADKLAALQEASGDDVRVDKVQEIKERIASGDYHVEAGDIADKIIEHLIQKRAVG